MKTFKIGIADTMFSRGNMGDLAEKTIKASRKPVKIIRVTVPGIKDLAAAASILFAKGKCDLVMVLGMPGAKPIDKQCAHEASIGIQTAQVKFERHILEVFVHEEEGNWNDEMLAAIMRDRAVKHAQNALDLLYDPKSLVKRAGTAQRQGGPNAKQVDLT